MSKRPRCTYLATFKAEVALAAVRGDKTLAELAQQHVVHANGIIDWKNHSLTQADVFSGERSTAEPTFDLEVLHAKMGQLLFTAHTIWRLGSTPLIVSANEY